MENRLEALAEEALEQVNVGLCRTGTQPEYLTLQSKPLGNEPGEIPTLPTQQFIGNGLRRRFAQREAARQRRLDWARAYVASGFDGDKALDAAGYNTVPRARKDAIRQLLNHPEVVSEIERIRLVLEQKADVATIDLAKEWVGIAKANVFDCFDQDDNGELKLKKKELLPKEVQKAVKSVKVRRRTQVLKDGTELTSEDIEVTMWDKHAALDSLAKIQGLYRDKGAEAIDNLAMQIAQRTEKYRKKAGQVFDASALEGPA